MNKLAKQSKETEVTQKDKLQKFREYVKNDIYFIGIEPNKLFKEALELYEEGLQEKDKKKYNKISDKLNNEYGLKLFQTLGLDTKFFLINSVKEEYKLFVIEMARELEKEYEVKSPSEKALVQTATLSFVQYLRYSGLMHANVMHHCTDNYLAVLSKETDRAYRRYVSSLQILQQKKSPSIKVNVKTNHAFVAQNQQINHNQHEHHENITP